MKKGQKEPKDQIRRFRNNLKIACKIEKGLLSRDIDRSLMPSKLFLYEPTRTLVKYLVL